MSTHVRIRSAAWSIAPQVVAFRGHEGISELYRFEVGVVWTTEVPFSPEDAVGDAVVLELDRDGADTERYAGVIEEVELVLEEGRAATYRVAFGPRLSRLALTEHSRVFTDCSTVDILRAVLEGEGVPAASVSFGVSTAPRRREHVCQYRESSLDFVRRLAEREGLTFSFRHEDEEHLAFVDDTRSAPVCVPTVRYVALAGAGAVTGEALTQFRMRTRMSPRAVRLHDYDPMRPRLDVQGEASVPVGAGGGDVVRWGEHVLSPDEARERARVEAERIASARDVLEGRGVVVGLRPGMRFELVDHPSLDGEYLVVRQRHRGRVGEPSATVLAALGMAEIAELRAPYAVEVTVAPAAQPYRAPLSTPWPRIAGVVAAFVDGAGASQYAQIDAEGRYRIRLHFDEGDTVDGSRSTWVRMLQPHGGAPEGMHFPLRKGTEVAVVFLGGDPDRPLILGVAPNPEKPSPVQRANHSQNVIQTGGNNRILMEDVAGGQLITASTPTASTSFHLGAGPKNFALRTDGRGRLYTGGDLDVDVDVNKTEDVESHVRETYLSTQDLTVTGPVEERLDTSLRWTIAGPVTHTWVGPFTETVDGHVRETFGDTLETTVLGALTALTYAGGLSVSVAGDVLERFTASQTTHVDGPLTLIVGSSVTERFGSGKRHIQGSYFLAVSGTYRVLTPNMLLQAPAYQFISSLAKKFVATKINVNAVKKTDRPLQFSTTGSSMSATGVSLSATGLSVTIAPTNAKSRSAMKKSATGADPKIQAVLIDKVGLLYISGGPKVS